MYMEITNTLPQFIDKKVLFAVLGKQAGVLYFLSNGVVEELETHEQPSATYTDREGQFFRGGRGTTYGSGSPHEDKDDTTRAQFQKDIAKEIQDALQKSEADTLYVFCPEHLKNEVLEALPAAVSKKVQDVITGNFVHEHPFKLIERIEIEE